MSAPMLQQLAPAAGAAIAIGINSLWEDALLVVCVWLLLRAWPRLNASTRYVVWSATLIATVVVPVATTLPFLTSSPPPTAVTGSAVRVPMPMVTHALTAAPATRPKMAASAKTPAAMPRLPERFRMTLPLPLVLAVLVLWALLAAVSFVRLAIGLIRLERLKRDALPLPVEYRDAMLRWTEANKGSRPVRLCVSDEVDVPVAVGLFDSMILIPRALLEKLSGTEVDAISLHELAHLRRADDWSNGLQRVAIALFAWNPGVLFVGQQLDLEREVACDDWVLGLTGMVRPYALCLAKMAETSSWPHRPMPAPGVFATRKHISLRIERLLGAGRNAATNLSLGPAAATVAIVGALAFVMQMVAPSVAASVETAQPSVQAGQVRVLPPIPSKSRFEPSKPPVNPAKTKEVIRYERVISTQTTANAATTHNAIAHAATAHNAIAHATTPAPGVSPGASPNGPKLDALQMRLHLADAAPARTCNACDMSGVDWSGRDMHGVNYTGVDLSKSKLQGTNFADSTFSGVDFSRSNLRNASFRNARLTGCDFSGSDLSNVDFTGAKIIGCDFTRAQLPVAQIRVVLNACTGCDFSHSNLSGSDLSGVRTRGVDLSHANLAGANLSNAQFTGVDFSRARLDGANLTGTVFSGCDLGGVDLSHVDLSKAKLIGTDLPTSRGTPHP
ncbi:MAG: pentapeptide repeat-containing protein [Candidatus Tumulicola sp.]